MALDHMTGLAGCCVGCPLPAGLGIWPEMIVLTFEANAVRLPGPRVLLPTNSIAL